MNVSIGSKDRRWGFGIGDTLDGLWAIAGLKEIGVSPKYFTPHPQWAKLGHDNVEHVDKLPATAIFLCDYGRELAQKEVRIESYCNAAKVAPQRPKIKIKRFGVVAGEYVVLAPYTAWDSRQWPISHWIYLESLIREKTGKKTVVVDATARIVPLFSGFCLYGQAPGVLSNIFLDAACVVANDSMAAHLGGLLEVKTIAIHAALPASALFKYYPSVRSIMPTPGSCQSCFFQHENGYRAGCDYGCHSLAGIAPSMVLEEIICCLK